MPRSTGTSSGDLSDLEARIAQQRADADAQTPDIEEPEPLQSAVAVHQDGPTSIQEYRDMSEDFDSRDVSIPRVKLAQPISKVVVDEVVKSGHWYYSIDNADMGSSIQFVPLKAFKHRAYFLDNQLLCRSTDMVRGIGTPGIECVRCSLKDWPEQRGTGGPPCRENYNFPAIILPGEGDDENDWRMGLITLMGTSSSAARTLLGMAFQRGAKNDYLQWPSYTYTLEATKKTGQRGIYYVAMISSPRQTEGELLLYARAQAESLRKVAVSEIVSEDLE